MIQRLALLLGGTLVALLLGELALARLAPQVTRSPRVWQFDADTGWANRPGARGELVSPEYDVEFAIDGEGLRGPEVDPHKPPGTLRVAIFGDSFAQGWGVAEPETLRARLEARLRDRIAAPIEVMNFGVAGYGNDQALLAFRKLGRRLAPDVVVLVAYGNDLWDNARDSGNGGGGREVPKPHFELGPDRRIHLAGAPAPRVPGWDPPRFPSPAWWARTGADLAQRSHVATLVLHALGSSDQGMPAPAYYERIYGSRPDAKTRDAWTITEQLIAAFDQEARAAGARFVLLYASDPIEASDAAWAAERAAAGFDASLDPEHPSRELARIAAEHGIAFVDLRPLVRREEARGPFFFHDRHWNAKGHALAADALPAVIAP